MLIRYILFGIFTLSILGSQTAQASSPAKSLRLVTFPIPLMVNDSEHGVFIALTQEIAKRNSLKFEISVSPTSKSILAFSNGAADVFFPAVEDYPLKNSPHSSPFYEKVDFIFHKKGHEYRYVKDLEGKKVGLTFRYHYGHELIENKRIKFEFADDDIANMRKLGAGEIDAFVVEEHSGLKALELSGVQDVVYSSESPVSRQNIYYAFQNSEEGRNLAQVFSKTIATLKKEGLFDKIILNHQPKISN